MDNLTNLVTGFMSVSTVIAILAILYVAVDWLIEKLRECLSDGEVQAPRRRKRGKACGKDAGAKDYLLAAILGSAAIAFVFGFHKSSTKDGKKKRKKNDPSN